MNNSVQEEQKNRFEIPGQSGTGESHEDAKLARRADLEIKLKQATSEVEADKIRQLILAMDSDQPVPQELGSGAAIAAQEALSDRRVPQKNLEEIMNAGTVGGIDVSKLGAGFNIVNEQIAETAKRYAKDNQN